MAPDLANDYFAGSGWKTVLFPERQKHRTTSKVQWQGKEIEDNEAKIILLELLTPRDEQAAPHMRLYCLDEALRGMFEVIAHTDLRLASSLEESTDSEATILSIPLKMDDCDWEIQKAMVQDFRSKFSNSKNERLRHFGVLDIKVILLLMHFEFRHTAPKLIWEHHDDDLKPAGEVGAEEEKRLEFKENETEDSGQAKPLHKKMPSWRNIKNPIASKWLKFSRD